MEKIYLYHTGFQEIRKPDITIGRKNAEPVTLQNFGPEGDNLRGIGPSDLARAVLEKDVCRPSMEMAYHVQEVLSAMLAGGENGAFADITSTCERPEPLPLRNGDFVITDRL